MRRIIKVVSVLMIFTMIITSCDMFKKGSLPQGAELYQDIKLAYSDKSEMSLDVNVFKRTAAGFLNYLDAGDKEGLKKLLSDALLAREDTAADLDEMWSNFKGHIVKTSHIAADITAGGGGRYENGFIVTTDVETYYFHLMVISWTNGNDSNEKKLIGINQIRMMTLDKLYGLDIDDHEFWDFTHSHPNGGAEGDGYSLTYKFQDGEEKPVKVSKLMGVDCYMITSIGNSSGYITVNTNQVSSKAYVWKLTGTKDSISSAELKSMDFSDAASVEKVFSALEPYAVPDVNSTGVRDYRFYNLSDRSDNAKAYVYYGGYPDVPRVRVYDLNEIYVNQTWE